MLRTRAQASLWTALIGCVAGVARANAGDAFATPLVPAVTRAELEAHVRFLASDELKGRVTGTPEAERAARYLARALEEQGVLPAGDDGSFLQKVPLVQRRFAALPELAYTDASGKRHELVCGVDFELPAASIEAKDLRVVVVRKQTELPKAADRAVALFIDTSAGQRRRWLEEAGLGDGAGFGLLLGPGSARAGTARTLADLGRRTTQRAKDAKAPQRAEVRVHGATLEKLRAGDMRAVSCASHVVLAELTAYNVVGKIAGRGLAGRKELGGEAVVLSAHYDHIGEHTGAHASGADLIWNGADDDASGTAAVIELAGALAHGEAPARTAIVLLATGEEIGLLGTHEYLDRPSIALEHTVANLNFEMIGRPDEKVGGAGKMWFTGWEHTNLGPAFAAAGLAIVVDPRPDQHFYERSDNYAFVKRGTIGQTFSTYNMHTDYHAPSDEADKLDYAHMETCTRQALRAVQLVLSGELDPRWTKSADSKR